MSLRGYYGPDRPHCAPDRPCYSCREEKKTMSGSLRLSPKHGVNPALMKCFYCQEPLGVVLMGRLKNDAEAPHEITVDRTPCGTCADWMAQGVILISVRDGEEGTNPWRTGGWVVLKDEAFSRIFQGVSPDSRVCFLEDAVWDMIGLPREGEPVPQGDSEPVAFPEMEPDDV